MNQKRYERGLKRVTGLTHSWKKSSKKDLILLKEQVGAMNRDLSGKLAKAITMGTAKAKKAEAAALSNMKKSKKALSTFAASTISAWPTVCSRPSRVAATRLPTTTCLSRHMLPLARTL